MQDSDFNQRFFKQSDKLFLLDFPMGRVRDWSEVDFQYNFELFIYDLVDGELACKAELIAKPMQAWLTLLELDTDPRYQRLRVASFVLKEVERFAKTQNYKGIGARLYENTPIGIDNLRHFYRANGFEVIKDESGVFVEKHTEYKVTHKEPRHIQAWFLYYNVCKQILCLFNDKRQDIHGGVQ